MKLYLKYTLLILHISDLGYFSSYIVSSLSVSIHLWKMAPSLCLLLEIQNTVAFLPAEIFPNDLLIYFLFIRVFFIQNWVPQLLLQIPITLISCSFFSQLNVSLFYCGIIFRNVFMLQFESSREIIYYCDWMCCGWGCFQANTGCI